MVQGNEDAMAFDGIVKPNIAGPEFIAAETAVAINDILFRNTKVDFWDDEDARKRKEKIEDYLFNEVKKKVSG